MRDYRLVDVQGSLHLQELAVRRWHNAMAGKYGYDRPLADLCGENDRGLLQAWRDIDLLIQRLDALQLRCRELEAQVSGAITTPAETVSLPAQVVIESAGTVFRRVPTSDDTISVSWSTMIRRGQFISERRL